MPLDARIHFALSQLTQSSPFVRFYSVAELEEELQLAGELFLQEQVEVILPRQQLILPRIFNMYPADFTLYGTQNTDVAKWIFQFLGTRKRLDLLLLLEKPFKVSYVKVCSPHRQSNWQLQSSPSTLKREQEFRSYKDTATGATSLRRGKATFLRKSVADLKDILGRYLRDIAEALDFCWEHASSQVCAHLPQVDVTASLALGKLLKALREDVGTFPNIPRPSAIPPPAFDLTG